MIIFLILVKKHNDEIIFDDNFSFTQNIVLRLVEQFRGRRLQILHDGWYASIKLSEELIKLGFLETTLYKSNTVGLPSKIKSGEEILLLQVK